jgi:hypothetical protein
MILIGKRLSQMGDCFIKIFHLELSSRSNEEILEICFVSFG